LHFAHIGNLHAGLFCDQYKNRMRRIFGHSHLVQSLPNDNPRLGCVARGTLTDQRLLASLCRFACRTLKACTMIK
jgi:hypothetical protein